MICSFCGLKLEIQLNVTCEGVRFPDQRKGLVPNLLFMFVIWNAFIFKAGV